MLNDRKEAPRRKASPTWYGHPGVSPGKATNIAAGITWRESMAASVMTVSATVGRSLAVRASMTSAKVSTVCSLTIQLQPFDVASGGISMQNDQFFNDFHENRGSHHRSPVLSEVTFLSQT